MNNFRLVEICSHFTWGQNLRLASMFTQQRARFIFLWRPVHLHSATPTSNQVTQPTV